MWHTHKREWKSPYLCHHINYNEPFIHMRRFKSKTKLDLCYLNLLTSPSMLELNGSDKKETVWNNW